MPFFEVFYEARIQAGFRKRRAFKLLLVRKNLGEAPMRLEKELGGE
jgi:hypothetical protein